MNGKVTLLGLTRSEFVDWFYETYGKGKQHAALAYSEWMRRGEFAGKSPAFTNARVLRQMLLNSVEIMFPKVVREHREGGIIKLLLGLDDGLKIESVVLPMQAGCTLCVSSQVGCQMGCTFCETGRMGLLRNLRAEEIVGQVWLARHGLGIPVRNLVFMGMGEPLDNYEAVMQAIRVLTDPAGLGIGLRNVTVSTSGDVAAMRRFEREADPALHLAVSVNAPCDEVRDTIMPINRTYNMAVLRQAMEEYCVDPRRTIFVEYVLLEGLNDSLEAADQLADYLSGLRVKVNVIPYNRQRKDRYAPPKHDVIEQFVKRLRNRGYRVLLRQNKGREIMAACGQLGGRAMRMRLRASGPRVGECLPRSGSRKASGLDIVQPS